MKRNQNVRLNAAPFFEALVQYVQSGAQSFHCPGHAGGSAFLKSPVGQKFHEFFGENMLRADVCNAVEELGQLLEHTGAIAEAEKNAARIFGADHLYFVTNGTSTSNKIVWQSQVGPDDIVVVDRNCHKSNLHGIIMTGATPVYLTPTRNHFGIIGPIARDRFSMASIQRQIIANPLIKDKTRKPKMLTLTQSTYDGILYNTEAIKQMLDGKVGSFQFDEAWLSHAAFHPVYRKMHAIGIETKQTMLSPVFSTQSTHKTLAGLSQASQILVSEAKMKKLNHHLFNESYLMHTSTSPQYSIIASCDVSAAMMDGDSGRKLVASALEEAQAFRANMKTSAAGKNWWFKVWGPENATDINSQSQWLLAPNDAWHGFGPVADGFNMIDPLKVTILTPGLGIDGAFDAQGIPAPIVARYLSENGVIVEKYGLYTLFAMFTIGAKRERSDALLAALTKFKDAYDRNARIADVMPRFAMQNPLYATKGLADLCSEVHNAYRRTDLARKTTDLYLAEPKAAIKPSDAFARLASEEIERVDVDRLEGKITSVLLTPYPPGIPLLVPGEVVDKKVVDYLRIGQEIAAKFPGFETDIHGLVRSSESGRTRFSLDCVREKPRLSAKVASARRARFAKRKHAVA